MKLERLATRAQADEAFAHGVAAIFDADPSQTSSLAGSKEAGFWADLQAVAAAQNIGRGATGPDVERLQHALVSLGFLTRADMSTGPGNFGEHTERAVRKFQAAHGIPATGFCGPLTRAKLAQLAAGGGAGVPTAAVKHSARTRTKKSKRNSGRARGQR